MKFGARSYFHKRVSFFLSTGGTGSASGGSASRRVLHLGVVCIQEGSASRRLSRPPLPEIHGILRDMVNKRAVRIPLECILV